MSEPKRHHYVPRSYLEFFARNNSVWVYDKKEKKYFNASLENVTVIQHYYSIISDNAEKNNTIEKHFSKVEGVTKPVIEKLDNGGQLDKRERFILALFIAYQFTRVPAYENKNKSMMDELLQTMKYWDIVEEEPTEIKSPNILSLDTPSVSARGLHNYLTELRESNTKFKNQHLEMMINAAENLVGAFLSLEWTFVYAGEGSSFITTSNPFTFTFHSFKDKPRAMGVLVKDVIKLFPISSKVCLMMGNTGSDIKSVIASANSVEDLNLVLVNNSDRYLIHHNKNLLEDIIQKHYD